MDTTRWHPAGRLRIVWIAACALALLPFLFVTIPPLADAPGHLGQIAIQAAAPDSPLRHYFGFHWGLRLNLGVDLTVELLRHLLGLERAFWLVCAAIPMLIVVAIVALARVANRDAAAASFALPFAYAYPFNFGFLNYMLGMALALLAFALWIEMAERPQRREMLFWAIVPALMICHAVGGGLLPLMIIADSTARYLWPKPGKAAIRAFLVTIRPLLAAVPLAVLAHGPEGGGFIATFTLESKASAIVQALRDQNRLLDIASMALVIAVPVIGLALGARYRRTGLAVVLVLAGLFLVMPAELNGSSYNDMRLVPALAIVGLVLLDWSRVSRKVTTRVMLAGFALFAVRMAVTSRGFAAYATSYAAEARALPHIAPGSRVLTLVTRQCGAARAWRMDRLDHFGVMATARREAWVNALWDVSSIHLLQITYRPSPDFYHDPSHYAWPAVCIDPSNAWERETIEQAAPRLPLDKVDYLWLIHANLPPGPWNARLVPAWSAGGSTLYRTIRPAA
ncbi:hypothetical protein [Sphingomonas sp. MMS24-J13]|uniref:hypothetical protein n=1 Tax=Sphingomonas sp. MMS24-J13 TaxID=3238686 RepID=UPI00384E83AE